MKLVLVISLCLFLGSSVTGQTASAVQTAVGIESISLARDDGAGKAGEMTEKFLTTDTPIHFLIRLDSTAPVTVRMNLVAVKAAGLKPETRSINVSYTTDGTQNQVNFDASPDGVWAAGSYRADIFTNGVFAESLAFEIEQSPNAARTKPTPTTENFAPRKRTRKTIPKP